jgi:hypothetical protein
MRGPRRPCWIIRVPPPLAARRMVEPLLAARSKRPVRPNLWRAARLARFSANPLAAAASACPQVKSHFAPPFNRPRARQGRRSAKPSCAGSCAAGRNRLAILRGKLVECKLLAVVGQDVRSVFLLKMFAQRGRKDACHAGRICPGLQ